MRPARARALGRPRRRWALVLAGWLVVIATAALGALAGCNGFVRARARPFEYDDLARVPARAVAIVPGASVERDGHPSDVVEDRLATALALYRAGKVQKILVSGDHRPGVYDEVDAMARWLRRERVPASDVFVDRAGFRTLDTMARAERVFAVTNAVVCTQRFHLPRAVFLARRAGIDAVGLTADHAGPRRPGAAGASHPVSDEEREYFAVAMAVLDSYVLHTAPRALSL